MVPSSALLENVSELAVPGWDHKPYLAGSEHAKMGVCVGVRQGGARYAALLLGVLG